MNSWLVSAVSKEMSDLLPLLVDASLQATCLIGIAWLIAWLMSGRSASMRHMIWTCAFAVILVTPVLSGVLPGWYVMPSWARLSSALVYVERSSHEPHQDGEHQSTTSNQVSNMSPIQDRENYLGQKSVDVGASVINDASTARTAPVHVAVSSYSKAPASIVALWGVGCLLFLTRIFVSNAVLRRTAERSQVVTEGLLWQELEAMRQEVRCVPKVRLLIGGALRMPMAWGAIRPCILVPRGVDHWTQSQRRSVLLHELAHVVRRDPLWQIVVELTLALYWFHPLVWLAAWRVHLEREQACDNLVLNRGASAADYARHLLDMVSGGRLQRVGISAGIAMASTRRIESRLRSIMAVTTDRRPLTRLALSFGIAGGLVLTLPLAMLRQSNARTYYSVAAADNTGGSANSDAEIGSETFVAGSAPGGPPTSRRNIAEPKSDPAEAAAFLAWRNRPLTEADHIVAKARTRSLGVSGLPQFLLRGTYWNGPVKAMRRLPDQTIQNLFKARNGEVDPQQRFESRTLLAWDSPRFILKVVSPFPDETGPSTLTSCHYWNGAEGYWGNLTKGTRNFGRFASLQSLVNGSEWMWFPIFPALSHRLAWPGDQYVFEYDSTPPELTRYKRVGNEVIDGEPCDIFDGVARFERLWIENSTGRLKAAHIGSLHRERPEYFTDLVKEIAGRTFGNREAYWTWFKRQSAERRAALYAHFSEAHGATTDPGRLLVFSSFREVAPGIEWPMRCERILVHPGRPKRLEGVRSDSFSAGGYYVGEGFDYIRCEIILDTAATIAPFAPLIEDMLPRNGDAIGDFRFDVALDYKWDDKMTKDDIQRLLTKKRGEQPK